MPKEDNQQIGHKFPFNACEILCSFNGFNVNRIMDLSKEKKDNENKINEDKEKNNNKKDYRIEINNIVKEITDKIELIEKIDKEKKEKKEENTEKEIKEENKKEENKEEEKKGEIKEENKEEEKKEEIKEEKKQEDIKKEENKEEIKEENKEENKEEIKKEEIKEAENKEENKEEIKEEEIKIEENKEEIKEEEIKKEENKEEIKEEEIKIEEKELNKEKEEEKIEEMELNKEEKEDSNKESIKEKKDSKNQKKNTHHKKNKIQIQEVDFDGDFIENDYELSEKEKEIELAKAELEALENEKEDYSDLYDLFDYLFKFLDEEPSDENYVLMGYFSKIVKNLLKVNSEILINYIYDDNITILQKLIKHINRKAIGIIFETIIMNINNMFGNKENIITSCKYLIDAFNNENIDENGFEVIYDVLVNSVINCNKQSFQFFISNEGILEQLNEVFEKFTLKNEEMKVINLIKLQIKINDEILNNFKKKITPNFNNDQAENEITSIIRALDKGGDLYSSLSSIKSGEIYYGENIIYTNPERLIKYLNKSCKVIIDDIMKEDEDKKEKCLVNVFSDEKIKKLGIKNYYEYECLKTILDLYINFYQNDNLIDNLNSSLQIIVDSKIFEKMIKIYFDYPMNNLYQNLFDQIIQISINSISPEILINSIFKINSDPKKNLIYLIIQNIVNTSEFTFQKSNNKMRPILLASNTNILKNIFTSENKYLKSIYENDNSIQIFALNFIPRVSEQFEKKLMQESKESDFGKAEFLNPNYDSQESEEDIPFSTRSLSDLVSAQIEIFKTFLKGGDDYLELINKEEEIIEKSRSRSQSHRKESEFYNDDKNDVKNKEFDNDENLYAFDYNKEINLDLDDINVNKNNFRNDNKENVKYFDNNFWNPSLNNFDDIDDIIEDL